MSDEPGSSKDQAEIVDWSSAKSRLSHEKKEKAAKDLQKRFQKAMGWSNWPKPKKNKKGSNGPTKPRGGRGKKR